MIGNRSNGLYRVNRRGEFNVPIGTKSSVVLAGESFNHTSKLLKNATLYACDFERVINKTEAGDLLYVDPPYTVAHNMNGFLKYNDKIFSWNDQERLRDCIQRAADRGVYVLASNANHNSIRDLYAGRGEHLEVSRYSVIAGPTSSRTRTTELLMKFNLPS